MKQQHRDSEMCLRPASAEEAGFFYALTQEQDEAMGTVGHVRIDFGRNGTEFWTTWHPRGDGSLNTQEFSDELDTLVNALRADGPLKSLPSMISYCASHGGEISGGWQQNYGYVAETEHYRYCLRCNPVRGDYNAYLTAFDLRTQKMNMEQHLPEQEMTMGGAYIMTREWLQFLREQFPVGSRIKLREMKDPYAPVEPGTVGTLEHIDDDGQFHMRWDNGRTLALIIGEDSFSVLPPEPKLIKLYMPLTADLYGRDEYGDMESNSSELGGRALRVYKWEIMEALEFNRMPEESERGIMHWYGEDNSVNEKVRSAVFIAEERDGRLWGVVECQVVGTLTNEELDTLKSYISGQASDGWGEGFEQRDIRTQDGTLNVHLWSFDQSWSIQTEEECFGPKFAEGLPEMCFSTLQTTGDLVCIKRGESGYYPSEWSTNDKEQNVEQADVLNEKLGVTPVQRMAMEIGALCGWDVPGADPKNYEEHKMEGMNLG